MAATAKKKKKGQRGYNVVQKHDQQYSLIDTVLPSMYQYYQTQLNTNKHVDKSHCKASTQGVDANIY